MNTNSENRVMFHTTRFAPHEAADVVSDADACGISISALIRLRVLNQPPPKAAAPAINRAAYSTLGNTGNNLNQLTHLFNSAALTGEAPPTNEKVLEILAKVFDAVKSARLQLLGADK